MSRATEPRFPLGTYTSHAVFSVGAVEQPHRPPRAHPAIQPTIAVSLTGPDTLTVIPAAFRSTTLLNVTVARTALYLQGMAAIGGLAVAGTIFVQRSRQVRNLHRESARVGAEHEVELRRFADELQKTQP